MTCQGESLVVAVDDDGRFTDRITDFKGRNVKEADKDIILAVKVIMVDMALFEGEFLCCSYKKRLVLCMRKIPELLVSCSYILIW